ncbi:MAG TPA: hypothetical protein DF480_04195 [Clostridiales bacterium]|nr:hypothetical protein [Clostridiales bacterium]
MRRLTAFIMIVMTTGAIASLFGRIWYILAISAGLLGVIVSGIFGRTSFRECGLAPADIAAGLAAKKILLLAVAPLILIACEVWIGIRLFPDYINCGLSILDRQLIFRGTATLVLHILFLTIIEEVPWRCFYQLNIGQNFPGIAALILPAAGITLLTLPLYNTAASAICLLGFFVRRLIWGYLYAESGSVLIVIISHWMTTLFYLVLLVGI